MTRTKGGALSDSRTIGCTDVLFRQQAANVPQSAKNDLQAAMGSARSVGITVAYGGTAFTADGKVAGAGEVSGIVVAFTVLAVALGSLLAVGFPLLAALVGVAIGVLFTEFLARFIQMTNTATVLATMIGIAVGIDYALFIVSRHREQLADPGQDVEDSIGRAIGTALLVAIKERGHRLVLASSAQQRHVDVFLDKLDARGIADDWTSSADVEASKPAPDLLQVALEKRQEQRCLRPRAPSRSGTGSRRPTARPARR